MDGNTAAAHVSYAVHSLKFSCQNEIPPKVFKFCPLHHSTFEPFCKGIKKGLHRKKYICNRNLKEQMGILDGSGKNCLEGKIAIVFSVGMEYDVTNTRIKELAV